MMSERVLWLRLCVTGPTPECGEIVGLRIVDRQAHRTVFDAFFHPVREDGWKSVPAGGTYVNLSNRLPLSIYVEGIERILSGATLLRGEHVARDIRFLRAAGVHLEDKVVARSVTAEHHKRLASGHCRPHAHREPGLPAHPGGMNTIPYPKQTHPPPICSEKERTMTPTLHARKGVLQTGRRVSATAAAMPRTKPHAPSQVAAASTMPDESPASNSSPSVSPVDSIQRSPSMTAGSVTLRNRPSATAIRYGQPGQARPPREHRFVMGQRLVSNRGSDRHDRGGMETQGHRCALQEPGYPVHRHETATENGNEARSVVFHHARRSIVLGDDIRSTDTHASGMISAAWDGP